jgi:protein TonB
MRLTVSLLTAVALHGVVLGVVAVLSHQTVARPALTAVDVDVVEPKPDPAFESARGVAEAPTPRATSVRPRTRPRPRDVAVASDRVPVESAAVSDATAPALANLTPTAPSVASPLHARNSETPSGNATISARPRYRTNSTPDYPLSCKRRREEGMVLLNVVVQADGLPAAVSLAQSSGHPLLDKAALDAVRRWTFEPGLAAGVPVSSRVVVPVRFSLSEQP